MMRPPICLKSLKDLKKIGHITPSSNTALETITALMNSKLSDRCSHHFTRLPVKAVRLDDATRDQFALDTMLSAAQALADAPLDAIVWNGTAASWLGLAHDEELCRRIKQQTGLPASTATLAFHEVFRLMGVRRIALAVPYVSDLTRRIGEVYRDQGIEVTSSAELGQAVNHDIGNNTMEVIKQLLRSADSPQAECIAVVCTNLPAALVIEEMEKELGKPIIDSIAVALWKGCVMAGVDYAMDGWGALMRHALFPAPVAAKATAR